MEENDLDLKSRFGVKDPYVFDGACARWVWI